jgi:hypothetical protein
VLTEENVIKNTVDMQIGRRSRQNLNSTAVAEFVGAPLKRRAKAKTVSLRAIIYQNFSEL